MSSEDPLSPHGASGPRGEVDPPAAPEVRRARAVDLFSPHRYRALQVSMFERKNAAVHAWGLLQRSDRGTAVPGEAAPAQELAADVFPEGVSGGFDVAVADASVAEEGIVADGATFASDMTDTAVLEPVPGFSQALPEPHDDGVWLGEEEPRARQGRNFRAATIVGIGLLAAVVVTAWIHPVAFAVLVYAAMIGAVIEWQRALVPHGRRVPVVPVIAATVGMGVATFAAKPEGLVVAVLVGCAGVVAWRIGDERMENTLADALAGVLTLLWIPFLGSFLILLELADDGWKRVLIVVLAVVANDTGALVAGMRFGKRKLLERVSPAKTWEGAIGGVVFGMAIAAAASHFLLGAWYIGAAVGAASAIAAVIGDLAESALKRDLEVKDMSSVLPGHGGILDRVDSVLFAGPVGYVVFAIFLGTLGGGGL